MIKPARERKTAVERVISRTIQVILEITIIKVMVASTKTRRAG